MIGDIIIAALLCIVVGGLLVYAVTDLDLPAYVATVAGVVLGVVLGIRNLLERP